MYDLYENLDERVETNANTNDHPHKKSAWNVIVERNQVLFLCHLWLGFKSDIILFSTIYVFML